MIDREPEEIKMKIYKDPLIDGCKASSFMDAGYIYAPYIPLQSTPTVMQNVGGVGVPMKLNPKLIDEAMSYYGKVTIKKTLKVYRNITDEWEVSRFD